ncbi:Phosphoserine phosphatase [Methylophaga frappieri]|uniref:Phosphoserine phosphatase n=1 Tax=Methylophaga frappieri (strain ATCC BAA-2434 / DSM 25690 / JAM7) TaxID=754477 RepID=I1YL02_METFJ|nr:phosphoserine phosphatase SerB [Methylophaga frappieri]AFJ03595.1 Phosphoserine phosphatase [Methylophaga frappieri]
MATLILHGAALTQSSATEIAQQVNGILRWQAEDALIDTHIMPAEVAMLRQKHDFDINLLPVDFNAATVRLLVMDMDSTLISIECIDEIADCLGLKPQVAAITEAAMRGELDFEASLRQRVRLLAGLPEERLASVYTERLRLNPGAEKMLTWLQKMNIKTALVSGGFTFFTDKLKQRLGLDFTQANQLGVEEGKLTGEVVGNICGAQAKADFLLARCRELAISPSQTIAMGDGANDLLMMAEAGLSIAYHAKPKVQQQADTAFNHVGLDGVISLLQSQPSQA